MSPLEWLRKAGAQGDVVDALRRFDDWHTLWLECPRGDWLLGIAERLGVEHAYLVRAAIACARIAELDVSARHVLDAAERWLAGMATAAEVATATTELEATLAAASDPAAEAASRAALAVGLGVADRGVLSGAPAAVGEAVMMASIDCGFELAMRWAHDKTATAVRSAIAWSEVEACVGRLVLPS